VVLALTCASFLLWGSPVNPSGSAARFAVVEAGRFVLRDPRGAIRGTLEVDQRGWARLALGDDLRPGGPGRPYIALGVEPGRGAQAVLAGPGRSSSVFLSTEPHVVLTRGLGDRTRSGGLMVAEDGPAMLLLQTREGQDVRLPRDLPLRR
jgi:hypothetical protein